MEQLAQYETMAFESACETITHLMTIYTQLIAEETGSAKPNERRLSELNDIRNRLANERANLHVDHHVEIARICSEYGQIIRSWNKACQYRRIKTRL